MTPEYKEPVALEPKAAAERLRAYLDGGFHYKAYRGRPPEGTPQLRTDIDLVLSSAASPSVREIGEPAVKALEWDPYRAETLFGYYHIDDQTDRSANELEGRSPFLLTGSRVDLSRHPTLEAARAAAQADFERRVLACLSPAPQAPATPPAPVPAVGGGGGVKAANDAFLANCRMQSAIPASFRNVDFDKGMRAALEVAALSPPAPSGVVEALRAQIDAEHSKVIGDDGYNYAAGQEYGLRLALIIIDKALAAIEEQAGWRLVPEYAIDWLMGEGPDADGVWFDDARMLPGNVARGAFWWRKSFRAMLSVSPKQETE